MNKKQIQHMLPKYQGNVNLAMLEDLGQHLGVSAESLRRLNLGWAPVVQFKKGPNFQGWWAIPERGDDGTLLGISMRSQSDMKVMYPGSKHGLTYELNPDHVLGATTTYDNGSHNWIRTMDVGIHCPICDKPDGCLLASDDPSDPKAVICIRTAGGSSKPLKWGYLHILKESGKIQQSASALPPSEHPVIVVEGMTDTAAAMDLGFVAVGRPSNLACMNILADLVRGRSVIIVGENDNVNPATGERPGHEGMIAAFQSLKKVASEVSMVLPPEEVKDLRQWGAKFELTADNFLEYVAEHSQEQNEERIIPDAKPLTLATMWLKDQHRMAGRYTLRFHKGQWYSYKGMKYGEVDEDVEIRGPIYRWCDNKLVTTVNGKGDEIMSPVMCTKGMVNNILDSLLEPCPLDTEKVPAWINGARGPDPAQLIPFSNGILNTPSYLKGDDESRYLLDNSPDFFTTFSLPFAFDPTAQCPEWSKYLNSTLDCQDKRNLLQEWFGYCITPDTSLHKLMLFRGPKRSGKSTAIAVLQAIVGDDQCGSISFAHLMERFGLEGLIGTQVAVMGDARLPRTGDSMRALELLLNIVGEDPVNIDRKFKKPLRNHRLGCRFTLASNELPELPDHAGAMEARLNIIDFSTSFIGKEDFMLRDRLIQEAPGIIVWALEGLRRLKRQGRFTLPEDSKESLREWRTATSPTAAFLEECCEEGSDDFEVRKTELHDAWFAWSKERGMPPISRSKFLERIKSNAPFARSKTYMERGQKNIVFKGLRLRKWAIRQYIGRPINE